MKKIAITLLLISLSGMALFAEGSQEETTWEPGMGRGYISEDQTNFVPGSMGRANSDQSSWNRNQMPMNNSYPNQNFQGRGSMRGGNNTGNQGAWGPSDMDYNNQNFNEENMTLTGKIDLTDVNLPKLTVGENTYELMVPYRMDYDIDIVDGDEITIQGFEVPAYRRGADSELTNLMVTGATFNGKDYDLDIPDNGPMAYNQRGGMMNNQGPINGRQGKSGRFNNSRNCNPQQSERFNRPYGRR